MKTRVIPLRKWQQHGLSLALKSFRSGQTNFMCVAAPGAGKTRFSAAVAKALLDKKNIDYVLCFAPSVTIANGIRKTFSETLQDRFDGRIGSKGWVITYQSIQHALDELMHIIISFRVLLISDEIHHCSFGTGTLGNQWGMLIESLIRAGNPLTLTLSGTPWRSNQTKIALQSYSGEPADLHIDFVYGLREAVHDKVCRSPTLLLLDNQSIQVTDEFGVHKFQSIDQAIEADKLKYGELLTHDDSLNELISNALQQLVLIRQHHPTAAGLVVASSIEEAQRISGLIRGNFSQSAVLVSHDRPDSHRLIQNFQHSNIDWIVSVGMISEGTDIPRLHVCAYLSNVRTELYFRQVLGRILRINDRPDETCTLVAFAEPKLIEFSKRIAHDLPVESMQIKEFPALHITRQKGDNLEQPLVDASASGEKDITRFVNTTSPINSAGSIVFNSPNMFLCEDSYRTTIMSL